MSETYKYALYEGTQKVQVESAVRDGAGANIENNYAKQNGFYESMGVGTATLADNFNTNMTLIGTTPYLFRTSGGSLEIGGQCKEEKFTGASVVWNQLLEYKSSYTTTKNGVTVTKVSGNNYYTLNNTATSTGAFIGSELYTSASFKSISGHKYLMGVNTQNENIKSYEYFEGSVQNRQSGFYRKTGNGHSWTLAVTFENGVTYNNDRFIPLVFDLTQMFGAGNEPTTVAQFRSLFPKDYYAYTATPYWLNVQTSGKKVVGFNAYDNTTGTAKLVGNNKYQVIGTYITLSFTDIYNVTTTPTLDSDNCFTPTTDGILTVTGGDATTTCVSLYWDGERSGEWEAYTTHTYAIDNIPLRGEVTGFDSEGIAIYDGDTYIPDGTITRKYQAPTEVANIPQFNQLWATSWFTTETVNGVTLTNNGDGSYSLQGTAGEGGATFTYTGTGLTLNAGSKYIAFNIPGSISFGDANGNSYNPVSSTFTLQPQFTIEEGADFTTAITFYPMFVNMTALCGASNELTSANFTALFPGDANGYYAYKEATANTDGAVEYNYRTADNTNYLYKLATPTTETASTYTEIQEVDNWGTEEFLTDNSTDVAMPVGHYTEYLPDLKAKLEAAPESPEENGYYLMQRDNNLNEYTPFNTVLTDNVVTINGQSVAGTGDLELVNFGIIRLTD